MSLTLIVFVLVGNCCSVVSSVVSFGVRALLVRAVGWVEHCRVMLVRAVVVIREVKREVKRNMASDSQKRRVK